MSLYIVAAKPTTLRAPLAAADTTVKLRALKDRDGNDIAMASFGEFGTVVVKQGEVWELLKFSGVTQNSDDTADLTVASSGRSLLSITPYTGASTGEDFNAGADVYVTNDPLIMSKFGNLENAQTWNELQTFAVAPVSSIDASGATELVRKSQLDGAVLGSITLTPSVVPGTAGETLLVDQLVYHKDADGKWWKCDADTAATVENVRLGITRGGGSADGAITGGVTVLGAHDASSAIFTANTKYYASNTAGGFSSSAGTKEVSIGFAISTTRFFLYPRYDQTITEDEQDALAGTSGSPSASNKYVTADDVAATATASKIVRANGSGLIDSSFLSGSLKFGGDGSDGALAVTSGTTSIDLGSAQVVVKQYTSISITGTGAINFINPHANGTIIILKSQGAVTLTSSAAPMIDASGMGAAGGTGGAGAVSGAATAGNAGSKGTGITDDLTTHQGQGGAGATSTSVAAGASTAGTILSNVWAYTRLASDLARRSIVVTCGSGGGGGGGGSGGSTTGCHQPGATGGRGGGGLIIECAGAWNFTTALGISVAGLVGGTPTASTDSVNTDATVGGGGGGGGAGGFCVALYNTLTANTGTINSAGGAGGTGGAANKTQGTSGTNGSASGAGGSGAGANGGAGGAGGAGVVNQAAGNAGSAAAGERAGGGGGSGGACGSNGSSVGGGAGGAAGASENVLVSKNYWFA